MGVPPHAGSAVPGGLETIRVFLYPAKKHQGHTLDLE